MRKKIVAGNWKMNTNLQEGIDLAKAVSEAIEKIDFDSSKYGLVIAPPFTHLSAVASILSSKIGLSAQNIAAYEKGAYTGEISAAMVSSTGANYVILGHSERRNYFGENSEILTAKLNLALQHQLTPIFCIGEVLAEREANKHFDIIKQQLTEVVFNLQQSDFQKLIIAYEPVWAIGTGKTATPEQAQEIHAFIRQLISEKYNTETAENTTILYGGSCNSSNAKELFSQKDIDGGLIGGASLKADDFLAIINSF